MATAEEKEKYKAIKKAQAEKAFAAAQKELDDGAAEIARNEKKLADAQKELQDLAVTATEKLVLQSGGDAFDQFLNQAERGEPHA